MDRIAGFIVSGSRRILAATGLITVVAALMLFRMDFNADVAAVVLEGNDTGETFKALQAKYDTGDPINVLVTLTDGSTFREPAGMAKLAEVRDLLAGVPGVKSVASIVPDLNPLTGEPLSPTVIASAPAPLVATLLDQSPVTGLLLDDGGANTLVLVVPEAEPLDVARAADDVQPPGGVELTFSGNPVVFGTVLDVLSFFLLLIPPVVIALLLLTFYATIGDRRLSILAIVPAALGSVWTFGLIFGIGREVDIVTVIVPVFVIVMGSADGLHFVTHFQTEAEETADPVSRVTSALRHVGLPMILTTISTAAGFASLVFTNVQPIQQLGLFAAIGITFAGVISFFSLPAILSRLDIEPRHNEALLGPRVTRGLRRLVRNRIPAAVLSVGLLAFAALSIPRLDVNSDQLFFFKDDDPVRVAFQRTEALFGGATPLSGEFVFDPATGESGLVAIREVTERFEALPGVRTVFSLADMAAVLPPDRAQAALAGDVALPLGDMVSSDGLRFVLLPADFDTADLRGWVEFAANEPAIRTLTGMPIVWDEIARLVLRAQVVSLLVAFALVTAMLGAAYRRLRQTVVSLVPIVLTVLGLLGFIAASGIQLNLITAVISSIVIGVGIDYAIHFVAAIDLARRDGPGYVLRAIDRAGRPIVANGLGIAIALSALWLSPLKSHNQIAMIMWFAMIIAALSALIVIPALLPRDGVEER